MLSLFSFMRKVRLQFWPPCFRLEEELQYDQTSSTGLRLSKFIIGAGQAMLGVLEEDSARREGEQVEGLPQRDIDFADSITVLKIDEVSN